jgi:hypothetical protein
MQDVKYVQDVRYAQDVLACLPNVDNKNIHATAVYIRFPLKRLRVVFS